jgi:GNAT superfamily N-acetyltransferase
MIKLKNILCEGSIQDDVEAFEASLAIKYPEIQKVGMYYETSNNSLFLSDMYIKPEHRGQGIGSKLMADIVEYADRVGLPLVLIPDPDGGMTRNQLIAFYKKFGFTINTGRKMDYSLSIPFATTMIRYPKKG